MNFLKFLEVELVFIKGSFVILKNLRFSQRKKIFLNRFKKLNDHFEISKNGGMKPNFDKTQGLF